MKKSIAIFVALATLNARADELIRPSRGMQDFTLPKQVEQPESAALVRPIVLPQERNSAEHASRVAVSRGMQGSLPSQTEQQGAVVPARLSARAAENFAVQASQVAVPKEDGRSVQASRAASRGAAQVQVRSAAEGGAAKVRSATARGGDSGLRPSVAEVGGRAVIERMGVMTGSNVDEEIGRKATRRARAASDILGDGVQAATSDSLPSPSAELSSCSAAYFDCLNQFCNVLDANQKQCSCSGRLDQYKRVEDSLNQANSELNNVAQQIRYIGLSADEVRSILNETEAEQVLSTTDDRTQSRKMLEEIEKIITSPDSGSMSSGGSGLDFDLDFSGDADSFSDLGSLFGNSESFANMRGTELYGAAKKKCSSILTRCASKKTDRQIISGQYDIEVDKACVAYEAGLKKAIQGIKTNVRSATQMLQKARLAVLEDQNLYDARGCVAALDSCMKDDMVCGSNYYKCLDPTKSNVDEEGKIIAGGDVALLPKLMDTYTNAIFTDEFLGSPNCQNAATNTDGSCVANYLLGKIGVSSNGHVQSGFCRPVLDKCRMITYKDGQYVPANIVVKSYLERTMTQIKSAANKIIAEYAQTCIQDVSTCYNSQMTNVNSYAGGTNLSPDFVKPVLMGACRNTALSCAYAVFNGDDASCPEDRSNKTECIDSLSGMFYQSMMCPVNSAWKPSGSTCSGTPCPNANSTKEGWVNSSCKCNSEYWTWNGTCVATKLDCPVNSIGDNSCTAVDNTMDGCPSVGCRCNSGKTAVGGRCT